jgi:hypothetical protein
MAKKRLTAFQEAARRRWPLNYKEHGVQGDGQFAVLCCTFFHPSARYQCYGELHLCETLEQAQKLAKTAYCHADSKGLCKRRHQVHKLSLDKK